MKETAGSFLRLTTPLRAWSQRFAFLLLIAASVGMIVLNRSDPAFLEKFRTGVTDAVAPVLEVFAQPARAVDSIGDSIENMTNLQEDNERLREEVAELKRWQKAALELKSENEAFRAMLNYVDEKPSRFVAARVVADSSSAFVRSALINAGAVEGVATGQAVVNGDGLIGRVVDVGERSARLLLITDLNSRIPVVIESSRDRAILAGDNSSQPRLIYLPAEAPVAVGDRVVTSGHGGVFPPGIPVGTISDLLKGPEGRVEEIIVAPFVNWNRVEHVRMIEYVSEGLVTQPPQSQAADTQR